MKRLSSHSCARITHCTACSGELRCPRHIYVRISAGGGAGVLPPQRPRARARHGARHHARVQIDDGGVRAGRGVGPQLGWRADGSAELQRDAVSRDGPVRAAQSRKAGGRLSDVMCTLSGSRLASRREFVCEVEQGVVVVQVHSMR